MSSTKKRQLANSPPPSASFAPLALPKPKKARPSKAAASTGPSSRQSPPPASSPAYQSEFADTPRPARSRSGSPAGAKGKAREDDGEDDGVDGEAEEDEEEEEEAGLDYSDDEFGMTQKENIRQKEALRVLLEHFDPHQMDRYEHYRRSGLAPASVRKLVNQVLQQSVSPTILTVVRGFSKVFVGELVEKAREVANHDGPLTPADLREAHRLYLVEHHDPAGTRKKMFVK